MRVWLIVLWEEETRCGSMKRIHLDHDEYARTRADEILMEADPWILAEGLERSGNERLKISGDPSQDSQRA